VAIEERAHEANQDAVFEHTATGDTLLFWAIGQNPMV
jgi:hypothetical protein